MTSLSPPNLDPIEVIRGALSFLSFSTEHFAHEVHTSRIQEFFSRSGIPQQILIPTLEALGDLREAERLQYGYWLPTPSRRVSLDTETCLLVSIAPTTELKRHFQSVRRAGFGRIADIQQVIDLPCQSLQSWLGTESIDSEAFARTQIESAINELKPSIASPDLKAFSINTIKRPNHDSRNEPIWLPSTNRLASGWAGVNLFRSKIGARYHRYFLGRILADSTLLEGPKVHDYLRLQYGLAALLGQPLTSSVVSTGNIRYLRLPLAAPRSARRALNALCESDPNSFGYSWTCRQMECWPTIEAILKGLRCEIANNE
jgi:hypothetical protein